MCYVVRWYCIGGAIHAGGVVDSYLQIETDKM